MAARAGTGAARMVESVIGCKWSLTVLALVRDGTHRRASSTG